MSHITTPLCVAACAALVAPAFAAEWMTDFDAAKAKAAAEDKAILMDFTGSDWCGPCMRLKQMVLDTPAFAAYAQDKFVLVEVDMPRNPNFDPEQRRRNEAIMAQYGVDAFPTLMVLTADGQVLGGFVGGQSTMEEVAAPLDAALANAPELKAAELLQGDEKVKALYALYRKMPKELAGAPANRLAELDVNDVTGIREETRAERELNAFRDTFSAAVRAGKGMPERLALVNEALQGAHPKNRIMLLQLKAEIQSRSIGTVEDVIAFRRTLEQIADADPTNAAAIRQFIAEKLADPAKALEGIKASQK